MSIASRAAWPHGHALVVAAAILLLVFAMPKKDRVNDCMSRVTLGWGLTYAHNCDSIHIVRDARSLPRYLGDSSPSRARPVHIVAVAAVAHVLSPVLAPLAALARVQDPSTRTLLPFYFAAVLVNVGVLAISYLILVRLVGLPPAPLGLAALAGLLASYDVAIAWFWIPHQILMNVMAPLGAVLAFVMGMRTLHLSRSALAGLGAATALGILSYGYCLVWPLAFGLGALWGRAVDARLEPGRLMTALLVYGIACAAPVLLWLGAFAALGREIAYEAQSVGQFVWVGQAATQQTLMAEIGGRGTRFLAALVGYLGAWGGAMLALAAALVVAASRGHRLLRVSTDPVVLGSIVAALLMLLFNFLQGYHQARLLLFPQLLAQLVGLRVLAISGSHAAVPPLAAAIAAWQVAMHLLGPPVSME